MALINGESQPGRRRISLAHELGHWLSGDAYDTAASSETEKLLNAFAVHFLAPRAGVRRKWFEREDWSLRDRALAVASYFRLSWTAAITHLKNLNLINFQQDEALRAEEPRRGDFARLQIPWEPELECPYLSPQLTNAIVVGLESGQIDAFREMELLRGTVSMNKLRALV